MNEFDRTVTLWVSGGNESLLRHLSDIAAVQVSLPDWFDQERVDEWKGCTSMQFAPISIFSKPILTQRNLEMMWYREYAELDHSRSIRHIRNRALHRLNSSAPLPSIPPLNWLCINC